jgi:hypothetical protein
MAANFERWFNEKYGKNQSYGRGVAFEAWNAAIKSVVEPFTSYNKQSAPCSFREKCPVDKGPGCERVEPRPCFVA